MTRNLGKHHLPGNSGSIEALPDLPDEVLRAPYTDRDPNVSGLPGVPRKVVRYLIAMFAADLGMHT